MTTRSARFAKLSLDKSHVTTVKVQTGYRHISSATFVRANMATGEMTERNRWNITPASSFRLVKAINRAADVSRVVVTSEGYNWHRSRLA